MAVPTIASVYPVRVLTAGGSIVQIRGTNFRLPPALPAPGPTARVLIGGVPSADVQVLSDELLVALVPERESEGSVALQVDNLDDDGAPIAGETTTLASAITYARPRHTREYQSDLARLVRTLIRRLKAQVLANTVSPVNTDATSLPDALISLTKVGELPALIVLGPQLRQNRFYSVNGEREVDRQDGSWVLTKQPYTVDVLLSVVGCADTRIELLNLMQNLCMFVDSTTFLRMPRLERDPSAGEASFEFDFEPGGDPKVDGGANESNLHQFSAQVVIRGFDIEDFSGLIVQSADDGGAVSGDVGTPPYIDGTAVPVSAVVGLGDRAEEILTATERIEEEDL